MEINKDLERINELISAIMGGEKLKEKYKKKKDTRRYNLHCKGVKQLKKKLRDEYGIVFSWEKAFVSEHYRKWKKEINKQKEEHLEVLYGLRSLRGGKTR